MTYDNSGREEMALMLKAIHCREPARFDPDALQKRDPRSQRLSRALASQLAKVGIGIKVTAGVNVEPPVTRAGNGVASNSIDAIAKALARPAGQLHDLHKARDWRDSTMTEPEMPLQSGNGQWDDVRADDGAELASDRQRGEYGTGGDVKPTQATAPQSSYMRNVSQGPQDSDIEVFKQLLSPKNVRQINSKTGFGD